MVDFNKLRLKNKVVGNVAGQIIMDDIAPFRQFRLGPDGVPVAVRKPDPVPKPLPQELQMDWAAEFDGLAQAPVPAPQPVKPEDPLDMLERMRKRARAAQHNQWANVEMNPFGEGKPMIQIEEGPSGFRSLTERSTKLPRFKLQYASAEECRMRLEGTMVTLQDRMVKVINIQMINQDGEYGLGCVAMTEDNRHIHLLFAKEGLNLRSPDPGFIQIGNTAYMYHRKPARVYKQGITGENTHFIKAGTQGRVLLFGGVPDVEILKAFSDRPVIQFDPDLMKDKVSMRLSDRVAVFKKNGGTLYVQHNGFVLGTIKKGVVKVENNCHWVEKALMAVGLEAVAAEE